MTSQEILKLCSTRLEELSGHLFDLLTVAKPISSDAAVNLSKVISKLSPLLGNLIEFNTVEFLNDTKELEGMGSWIRQDPGFPDAVFIGEGVKPTPGFEIKAWFPLATEITARFKDSQNHFVDEQTNVCLLAWLPDQLIYGTPRILDVCVFTGSSIAKARDDHYHNPPDYIVLEPEDTTARTQNLQQTNNNGYKWQGSPAQFSQAQKLVKRWGKDHAGYRPTAEYQLLLRQLLNRFPYRLDTNFAKLDRIGHDGVEAFKSRVMNTSIHGLTIAQWSKMLAQESDVELRKVLQEKFDIKEELVDEILK